MRQRSTGISSPTKSSKMPKKQKKQGLITESEQCMSDIEKAVAVTPRAVAPVAHAPGPITEEEPEAAKEDGESSEHEAEEGPEHEAGETAEFEAGEEESDKEETGKEDKECKCSCDGDCQCNSSKDQEDSDESEADEEESDESEAGEEEDEEEVETDNVDMEEDVNALMNGEANLTEGFKSKAKTIFEAAVKSKVRSARKELHEGYQRKLGQKAEEILSTVTEQVDSYLTYVVESWMKENQVAVDSTLRTEIAEGFITSLKNVFAESYIEVPKADKDLVESLNSRVSELQEQVKQAGLIVESSKKQNEGLLRKAIVAQAAKGLAVTQASKLTELTKDTVFESVESFTKKVATIKESYFSGKAPQSNKPAPLVESAVKLQKAVSSGTTQVIVEGQDDPLAHVSADMKRYLGAISRVENGNPNRK